MPGKIAAITSKIATMFAMLATTGGSLPGANIRPPARTVGMQKVVVEQVCSQIKS